MRILHVIPSVARSQGGPSFAILAIARSLAMRGVTVDIVATTGGPEEEREIAAISKELAHHGIGILGFKRQSSFYKYSYGLLNWVNSHIVDYDAVHVHALFSHAPTAAALCARNRGVPYVVRPLGVLNRWGMSERRPLFKTLSFRFRESKVLKSAAAVHFTSKQEQFEAESLGRQFHSVVIPLGIDLSPLHVKTNPATFFAQFPEAAGRPIVLFLSRVDPKKGLELLIPAFANALRGQPNAMLVVAGSGDSDYVASLKALASQFQIEQSVIWTGFLDGERKLSAFAAASIYVLPSHSENFGIAAVEAMAAGLPCVLTRGVAISEGLQERNAAVVPDSSVESISKALESLLLSKERAAAIGANAKEYAHGEFEMAIMGKRLHSLYCSILGRNRD